MVGSIGSQKSSEFLWQERKGTKWHTGWIVLIYLQTQIGFSDFRFFDLSWGSACLNSTSVHNVGVVAHVQRIIDALFDQKKSQARISSHLFHSPKHLSHKLRCETLTGLFQHH